jgi:hypothetical protein
LPRVMQRMPTDKRNLLKVIPASFFGFEFLVYVYDVHDQSLTQPVPRQIPHFPEPLQSAHRPLPPHRRQMV